MQLDLEHFREKRDRSPVWLDPEQDVWNVYRYADVIAVLTDHATFSSDFRPMLKDNDHAELADMLLGAGEPEATGCALLERTGAAADVCDLFGLPAGSRVERCAGARLAVHVRAEAPVLELPDGFEAAYGRKFSFTSANSCSTLAARPAPVVPDFASINTGAESNPARASGARPSSAAVG